MPHKTYSETIAAGLREWRTATQATIADSTATVDVAAIAVGDTTFAVQTGEGALFAVGDYIQLDDEIMHISGISTDTLTVQRGVKGTDPATHADDTPIFDITYTSGGGTALTTTLSIIGIPLRSDYISITARNFVGCAVARVALNPWLTIIHTTDSLVDTGNITDISEQMQNNDTIDYKLGTLDTAANDGFVYVGSPLPFIGVKVDIGPDVQATTSVLTVKYGTDGGWIDLVDADGTESGGATLAVDGDVTWAIPTTWKKTTLLDIGDTTLSGEDWSRESLYWTRWEVSAQIDSTDLKQMRALTRSPDYAELIEGQSFEVMNPTDTVERIACIEALTDAGTCNLIVNVATRRNRSFD
ncbi:hypothetical protein LCGC14_2183140, partial [marine sediment metagenome]